MSYKKIQKYKNTKMASDKQQQPIWVSFLNGGLSGMAATCVVQPVDLIKTRMQLAGEGTSKKYPTSFHAATDIIKKDGLFKMYNGFVLVLFKGLFLIIKD